MHWLFRPGKILPLLLWPLSFAQGQPPASMPATQPRNPSIFAFPLRTLDGQNVTLEAYRGNVLLIVNVASRCGYTRQYAQLQELYQQFQRSHPGQGLVILGFPANNFLGQEPGTNAEIKAFCQSRYQVSFPMFSKISVKGPDIEPLFAELTNPQAHPKSLGAIKWNFEKFLIAPDGSLAGHFRSSTDPLSLAQTIEKLLEPGKPK